MSTRSTTLIIDRSHAENNELGFAIDPQELIDNSYINMYIHYDGYLEGMGCSLANWILDGGGDYYSDPSKMTAKLVNDFYKNRSQYLYPTRPEEIDCNFTYVIWIGKEDLWISCYDNYKNVCVFVGTPSDMIAKYETNQFPIRKA